ncbi:hypothetical protein NOK12_39290 [Nocardioides sp. OK12]|nr:hypothetical protein NOK12_39290 [Nocardioides sp. OK12]
MFCKLLDELEELLGTILVLPALLVGDINARFNRWDTEGWSNRRGELLCVWANRINLGLLIWVGYPTCVRPKGSSGIYLMWGIPAGGFRLSNWKVVEAESLSGTNMLD